MAREIGEADAQREIVQSWQDSFSVLDDVFESFVTTNVHLGRHYSWEEVRVPEDRKRYLRYEHLSIPYLATKFTVNNPMSQWVNIKLNCNGFTWPPPPERSISFHHPRHNATGWVVLPDGDFFPSVFPYMSQCFQDVDGVCMYYSQEARRIDMKFFFDGTRSHVLVTFEMGHPYFEDYLDNKYMSRRF